MPCIASVNTLNVRERTDCHNSRAYDPLHYEKHEPLDFPAFDSLFVSRSADGHCLNNNR